MVYFNVSFVLFFYFGDCFDRAVVLLNSWICVSECPVRVSRQ